MKFVVQDQIIHRRQELHYSCGAAAVAMLVGQSERVVRPLVACTSKGTCDHNVANFFNKFVGPSHSISLRAEYEDCIKNLTILSLKFPIYCSATYLWKNPGRGRPITRHHASIFVDGMIYDPSESRASDPEAYVTTFNKRLTYNNIIVVEIERPDYIKNFWRHELAS